MEKDGSVKSKVDGFVPFSMGKRTCMGEFLARAELFTILGALLWNYRLKCDPNKPKPSLEPALGTTLSTENFNVLLEKR